MRVLSSLILSPLGASHAASRCLTCFGLPCGLPHIATRSSAYLTSTGAARYHPVGVDAARAVADSGSLLHTVQSNNSVGRD